MEIELFYAEPRIKRDLADIALLTNYLSPGRKATVEDALRTAQNHTLFVARNEKGRIVGAVTLVVLELVGKTVGRIEDVIVHPKFRGQGIGKELMAKAIWFARESGYKVVDLTARPGRNAAQKLYRPLGFKRRKTNVYRLEL